MQRTFRWNGEVHASGSECGAAEESVRAIAGCRATRLGLAQASGNRTAGAVVLWQQSGMKCNAPGGATERRGLHGYASRLAGKGVTFGRAPAASITALAVLILCYAGGEVAESAKPQTRARLPPGRGSHPEHSAPSSWVATGDERRCTLACAPDANKTACGCYFPANVTRLHVPARRVNKAKRSSHRVPCPGQGGLLTAGLDPNAGSNDWSVNLAACCTLLVGL